ncbi:MAG TPA: chemotaxis protein CheC [Clostridiales bacterium]|nr:chemotaxis protein CheC [Clostridiales bacterium]
MSKFNYNQMDSIHFDVLKEVGNIGSGNAATALAQLIQDKVNMEQPQAELIQIENISDIVGGAETIVTAILITLEGDIEGMMMFMLDHSSAGNLSNILLKDIDEETINENKLDESAIKESGNIIAGAYLRALSKLLNITIEPSIPYLSVDMAGAILSVPAIEFGKLGDDALIIETKFWKDEYDVSGYFILIPTLNSYEIIMNSLGL